jgi:hypothetical protein
LRTESGPESATGRMWAACTSARPPQLMIFKPATAHVLLYAALTADENANREFHL